MHIYPNKVVDCLLILEPNKPRIRKQAKINKIKFFLNFLVKGSFAIYDNSSSKVLTKVLVKKINFSVITILEIKEKLRIIYAFFTKE